MTKGRLAPTIDRGFTAGEQVDDLAVRLSWISGDVLSLPRARITGDAVPLHG